MKYLTLSLIAMVMMSCSNPTKSDGCTTYTSYNPYDQEKCGLWHSKEDIEAVGCIIDTCDESWKEL